MITQIVPWRIKQKEILTDEWKRQDVNFIAEGMCNSLQGVSTSVSLKATVGNKNHMKAQMFVDLLELYWKSKRNWSPKAV